MPTYHQLEWYKRKRILSYSRAPSLQKCPHKKGTCLRVFWISPKKPNSANRRVTKVLLTNKRCIQAHIPGIGHNLQKHSVVLIRGCRVRDIPGMKYRPIRNVYSLEGMHHRRRSRSKYGGKAFK